MLIPVHSSPSLPPSPPQSITAPGRPFRAVRRCRWRPTPVSPNTQGRSRKEQHTETGPERREEHPQAGDHWLRRWFPPGMYAAVHYTLTRSGPYLGPSCLSSCPLVFLGRLLVSPLPQDRPAAVRSKAIKPWHAYHHLHRRATVPALASSSSSPRGCSTRVKPTAG